MALSDKQKAFAAEYIIDKNATQAALRAGYKGQTPTNASRWLDKNSTEKYNQELFDYVQQLLDELQIKPAIASAEEVLEYFSSVVRGDAVETVVQLAADGEQVTIEKPVAHNVRVRAAEDLAKRYGLFTENIEVHTDASKQQALDSLRGMLEQMQK